MMGIHAKHVLVVVQSLTSFAVARFVNTNAASNATLSAIGAGRLPSDVGRSQSQLCRPLDRVYDLTTVRQAPSNGLFPTFHLGGGHVTLTDCSIKFFPQEIDENVLWAYFTRGGGR